MAKKNPLKIHVVLDTNAVFTDAAEQLLSSETKNLISETSESGDLELTWHLPYIVKGERRYQMLQRAKKLMPSIAKLESLLGHKLGISEEIISDRVDKVINDQMASVGLIELNLDQTKVQLMEIIDTALARLPPFESGEREKGFRDAVILESFYQLLETLPASSSVCRVYLISGDQLVKLAAQKKLSEKNNAKVLSSLDELRTIINALKSETTDALLNEVLPIARAVFFSAESDTGLYYKAVREELFTKFSSIIYGTTTGSGSIEIKDIFIHPTTFINKVGQKITFETKIRFLVEVTTQIYSSHQIITGPTFPASGTITGSSGSVSGPVGISGTMGPIISGDTGKLSISGSTGVGISKNALSLPSSGSSELFTNITSNPIVSLKKQIGTHVFTAQWHATYTVAGKLTQAKLDKVSHLETEWED